VAKTYKSGIVLTGDASGAVRAVELTDDALRSLNGRTRQTKTRLSALVEEQRRLEIQSQETRAAVLSGAQSMLAWGGGFASAAAASTIWRAHMIRDTQAVSRALGVSITDLQALQYAGESLGVSSDKVGDILKDFSEKLGIAFRDGTGDAMAVIDELGMSLDQLRGLSADQQFLTVFDRIGELSDRNQQISMLEDLASDASLLIPILGNVTGLMLEAKQVGYALSEQDAQAIVDYSAAWDGVGAALTGVGNQVTLLASQQTTGLVNGLAAAIRDNAGAVEYLGTAATAGVALITAHVIPAMVSKVAASRAVQTALIAEATAEKAAATAALRRISSSGIATASATGHAAAVDRLSAATLRYNSTATLAGRASGMLSGGLAMLGGPLGVGILAATAMGTYAASIDTAAIRAQESIGPIDGLALAIRDVTDAISGANDLNRLSDIADGFAKNGAEKVRAMIAETERYIKTLEGVKEPKGLKSLFDGSYDTAQENLKGQTERLEALQLALKKLDESSRDVVGANEALTASGEKLTEQQQLLLKEVRDLSTKYGDQRSKVQTLRDEKARLNQAIKEGIGDQQALKKAIVGVTAAIKKEEKATKTLADKNALLIEHLDEELRLLGLSEKERAIQINLKKLDKRATDDQRIAVRNSTAALYDKKEQLKAVAEATKEATKETDPFVKSWEEATKRIDASFADAWKGSFDSFEDFTDNILGSFKTMLAEMAHQATTKKIVLNIQQSVSSSLGIGGSSGGGAGGLPGGLPSLSNLADTASGALDFFNPASGGTTAFINSQAQSLGYGMAADGMGPPTQLLIDPSSGLGGALNAAGPALAAFGLSKKHGPIAGVAGGAGSAALAGGISGMIGGGGFLSGASGALAGLGPAGWLAIGLGAVAGMLGPKPSDKTQWAGTTGGDGYVYSGGENGDKLWQEGRDAATHIASMLSAFDQNIARFDGVELTDSYEVGVGQRDGAQIRVSDAVENADDLQRSPNGSEYFSGGDVIFSGTDLTGGLDAAFARMAKQAGIQTDIYTSLAQDGEALGTVYERLNLQVKGVDAASDALGLKFDASADDQLRLADQLVQSAGGLAAFNAQNAAFDQQFFTNAERQQRVYDDQLTRYDDLESVLRANNLQLDGSKTGFRELITGIDGSTLAGAELRAELLQYQNTVAFLAPAMVAANEAGASGVEVFYDLQQASEDLGDTISRVSSEVETFTEYNTQLGWGLQLTGDELISVADGFIQSAGGMQQFSASMNTGMSLLYTDAERASMSALDAARNLGALNAQQGLYGDQLITNMDQARAYADAQDLSTAAGQRAYLAAIEMAQAIDALGGSLSGATAAAGSSGSSGGGGTVSSSPGVMIDIEQLQDELAAAQAAQITAAADIAAAIADAQEKIDYYSTFWGDVLKMGGVDEWIAHWQGQIDDLSLADDGSTAIDKLVSAIDGAKIHNANVTAAQATAPAVVSTPATTTSSGGSSYVAALQLQPGALEQLMQSVLSESGYLDWLIEQRQQPIDEYNSLHDTAISGFADLAAVVDGLEVGSQAWIEAVNVTGDLSAWLDAQAQLAELQQSQVLAEYQPDIDGYWQQYLDAEDDLQRLYDDRLEQLKAEQGLVAELGRMQDSLALSAQSPLTPQQRYDEAQAQYREVLAAVQGGDTARLSELQSAGQAYLTESQGMYGSSAGALSVYSEVSGALDDLALTLDSSSYEDKSLALEQRQRDELERIRAQLERQLRSIVDQSAQLGDIAALLALLPEKLSGAMGDALSSDSDSGDSGGGGAVVVAQSPASADAGLAGHQQVLASFVLGGTVETEALAAAVAATGGVSAAQEAAIRSAGGWVDGSHRDGLPRVPFDGYIGELHRDEAVLTAPQAEAWRAGQSAPPLPLLAPLPPPPVIQSASRADNASAERELRAMSATIVELSETIERLMTDQVEATNLQTTRVIKQLKISPRRATSRTPRD